MRIAIVLFDGFDDLDAIGPFEVFQHARPFGADLEIGLYTLEPQDVVTSSHGLRVQSDGGLDAEDDPDSDLVIVPGGGWVTGRTRASGARPSAGRSRIA